MARLGSARPAGHEPGSDRPEVSFSGSRASAPARRRSYPLLRVCRRILHKNDKLLARLSDPAQPPVGDAEPCDA